VIYSIFITFDLQLKCFKKMKKLIALLIFTATITACNQTAQHQSDDHPMSGYMVGDDQYTQAVEGFMKSYTDNDFENADNIFADDAVFYVNDTAMSIEDMMTGFGVGHQYFDNIAHSNVYSATMYYNDGKIYTNVWYDWSGTLKSTGESLELRGYVWFEWENGKVVEAYNAFDPTAYAKAIESQMTE
jgi:hypothetical protein